MSETHTGDAVTVERPTSRRRLFRAIAPLEGWIERADIVRAVDRLISAPAGYVDYASQITVTARTRRRLELIAN